LLFINSPSHETINDMIKYYNLPDVGPETFPNLIKVAEYVFASCFHLIPTEIKNFFNINKDSTSLIKSEILLHMIINAHMSQLYTTEGNVKRTGALLTKVFNFYLISLANSKTVYDFFGSKDTPRVAKAFLENHSCSTIPAFAAPLIAFQALHSDAHKVLKDLKNSDHSKNFCKHNKDIASKLHLNFYDNFIYLVDNFLSIKSVERQFEHNSPSYHPTLNKMLFEREYNLGLASKIMMMTLHLPYEMRIKYIRLLAVASMLPNINGRLFYITSIFTGNARSALNPQAIDGEELNMLPTNENEHLSRLRKLSRGLLGMSLITIPVMETFFLYNLSKINYKFNLTKMKTSMEAYEKSLFSDYRVQRLSTNLEGQAFNFCNTYGFSSSGEWELADLSFDDVREVLTIMNEVRETQMKNLSTIYANPQHFLENSSFDDLSLLMLDGNNPQKLLNAVCDVVEENHLQVFFKDTR